MSKRPGISRRSIHKSYKQQQQTHSWTVYHLKSTPAKLVGIVGNQPDQQSAIKAAIEKFGVPVNERGQLMAQRRN